MTVYDRAMDGDEAHGHGSTRPCNVAVLGTGALRAPTVAGLQTLSLNVTHYPDANTFVGTSRNDVDIVVVTPAPKQLPQSQRLKASRATFLPVVVILDANTTLSRTEVLHDGADDVLSELPTVQELELRIQNWVRIKRAHDELLGLSKESALTTKPPNRHTRNDASAQESATRVTMHGLIETRLRTEHARAQRHHQTLAFAYFAVDDARQMLERFGNAAVDDIAQEISTRMNMCFRDADQVSRIDTLGFGVILPHTHFERALNVTARAHREVTGTYKVAKQPLQLSLSVGVSLFPSPRVGSYRELGTMAQLGANQALAAGGNRICVLQNAGYMFEP